MQSNGASSAAAAASSVEQLGNGSASVAVVRQPLSKVVADCAQRWYVDTLKEAKAGDLNMQVLVSQMYYSGYGVAKDAHKGRLWMARAARHRSSVWKVSDKRPGYNASDSDSDEMKSESLSNAFDNSREFVVQLDMLNCDFII
ncbi:hypothetical protein V2J09_007021 [Rumex salicifolius]